MLANALDNLVDSERLLVHLHRTLDDALRKLHVYLAVVYNAISHERVDNALQFTNRSVSCRSDELYNVLRYVQPVVLYLSTQDICTKLHVRLLHLGDKTA